VIEERPETSAPPESSDTPDTPAPPTTHSLVSRRTFLAGTGVVVGIGLFAGYEAAAKEGASTTGLTPATTRTLEDVDGWLQPQTRRSAAGALTTTFEVSQGTVPIGTTMVEAITYEHMYPGPTLDIDAGDVLSLDLVNNLSELTNLHTHGFHVSPRSPGDNVLLADYEGGHYQYRYELPANHPGGTYWYHAHWGMLTDVQVYGGLFGAIIIRGELDALPGIAGLPERVMVLSQIQIVDGGIVPGDMSDISLQNSVVNGLYQPTADIAPGETQRWRIVNASSLFFRLTLDGHPMRLIGIDGNALAAAEDVDLLEIPPGGRADVLVTGKSAGTVAFRSLSWKSKGIYYATGMVPVPQTLLQLRTHGSPVAPSPAVDTLLPFDDLRHVPIARRRVFQFAEREPRGTGHLEQYKYFINGQVFDTARVNDIMLLGTTEEWELVNLTYEPHPVHIHVNPFQVIAQNGEPLFENFYRDTVLLEPFGSLTIRHRFDDFTGIFVWHCHILFHEDNGMMRIAEVVPTAADLHGGGPRMLSQDEQYAIQHGLTGSKAPI
jgi:FtsP/CotA-like multicopper oxidase with cupredoxin domain